MKISFSRNFIKQARKLNPELRTKIQEKMELFSSNPIHPSLRNHQLRGKYKNYRSIDITGDLRVLYLQRGDEAIFDTVGTHSQLYG